MKEVSIISQIENDYQLITFDITKKDLEYLTEKYKHDGYSVRGTLQDIIDELNETFPKKYEYSEETTLVMDEFEWNEFYKRYVDKVEYPTFPCWWYDMHKMNLIKEI